jgi:RNA polymerase sigma factor for flagellar operon FliA
MIRDQEDAEVLGRYLPLAREVAARILPSVTSGLTLDDLVASGVQGLLAAVAHYRPERGMAFTTYARLRIRGAIIDDLRRYDRRFRLAQRAARRLDRASTRLAHALGREPDGAELARELALSRTALDALRIRALGYQPIPLDTLETDAVRFAIARDEDDPCRLLLTRERARRIRAAIAMLPAQHEAVVRLYYERGLRLREVGARLGVTESRASQVHREALARLRPLLARYATSAPPCGPTVESTSGARPSTVNRLRRGERAEVDGDYLRDVGRVAAREHPRQRN